MHKTTALYCRTALADAEAIARQRESLRRFAEEKGFTNLTYYEDDGCSGLNPARPAFLRLEQDIRDGKVARVIAPDLARLGRNTAEVVRWLVWLRRHGVELTLLDGTDLSPLLAELEK